MGKSKKVGVTLIAMLIALISFLGLMFVTNAMTTPDKDKWQIVIRAKQDILSGSFITKDNVSTYFDEVKAPDDIVTANTIKKLDDLLGTTANIDISSHTIIQKNFIVEKAEMLHAENYENCTEIAIKSDELSAGLAGRVRPGERVDILATNSDGFTYKVADNVYVAHTYDNTGVELFKEDTKTVATLISVLVDTKDKEAFVSGISSSKLYVTKKMGQTDTEEKATVYNVTP